MIDDTRSRTVGRRSAVSCGLALGLGSSDPDALGWLRRAVAALKALPALSVRAVSPIYESDALLPPDAPASWNVPYLNLVVACDARAPDLSPLALLELLKQLEKNLGRQERERWAPREIDIDILAWTGVKLRGEKLSIPHAGLLERPFALLPLADVAAGDFDRLLEPLPEARSRIQLWKARGAQVPFRTRKRLDRLTECVAIFNLTPDSFSDGGKLASVEAIQRAARAAIDAGARILDLGAESTRPGAAPVSPDEEWRRILPALKALEPLRGRTPGLKLSLDSRHPETMERALEHGGIDWLNDVTGFDSPRARALAAEAKTDVLVMHSLGVPPSRARTLPETEDPIEAVLNWGHAKLAELAREGIDPGRVILDPGVGFGKTAEQSFEILRGAWRFHAWGTRVLIGHSRKSFLSCLSRHARHRHARHRHAKPRCAADPRAGSRDRDPKLAFGGSGHRVPSRP